MEVSQNVCKNVRWVNSVSEDIANLDFEVLFRKKNKKQANLRRHPGTVHFSVYLLSY